MSTRNVDFNCICVSGGGYALMFASFLISSRAIDQAMIYLCATMWHETYEEMVNILISIFR